MELRLDETGIVAVELATVDEEAVLALGAGLAKLVDFESADASQVAG